MINAGHGVKPGEIDLSVAVVEGVDKKREKQGVYADDDFAAAVYKERSGNPVSQRPASQLPKESPPMNTDSVIAAA